MTLSRKDTILIAVLMNLGLLSILLMTALQIGEEQQEAAPQPPLTTILPPKREQETLITKPAKLETSSIPVATAAVIAEEASAVAPIQKGVPAKVAGHEEQQETIAITIKRGDALEKIARHNGTTVKELRRINHLATDNLTIGQVLRVPLRKKSEESTLKVVDDEKTYIVQVGDNPWKIARKCQVNYEDILLLNNLDEDRAKNMKPGDVIRVR